MPGHVIDDQFCPFCGYHVNRAANIEDYSRKPRAGDIVICLECGRPLLFNETLTGVRKPTGDELLGILDDPEYRKHKAVWNEWKRRETANGRRARKPGNA